MVRTVLFDFDMTLVDSIYAITRGLNTMAEHFNLRRVDESDTRRVMSLAAADFWTALWGDNDPAWGEYFLKAVAGQEKKYLDIAPGAVELLTRLKSEGFGLGLATNRDNAWYALASIGLAKFFDTAVGTRYVPHGKPAPDMIFLALSQMGVSPGQAMYVGDSATDMQAASRAGVRAVGILEGGASKEELLAAGAWQVRPTLNDLDDILNF
ncbi:MAG: HAD family hydrolase [Candidatus Adiutrix sp.]|jgi:HAD superfamily hydrolase (TIGR01509 family)|nr:HAD family hydrolase [Candidatus Adiutrix sp.]